MKIVKKGAAAKWSFSNLAAMVRLHLMTYIDLGSFLRSPEKALMKMFVKSKQDNHHQLLLITQRGLLMRNYTLHTSNTALAINLPVSLFFTGQ